MRRAWAVGLVALGLSGCAGVPNQAARYCAAKDGFVFETNSGSCAPLAQQVSFSEYLALKERRDKRGPAEVASASPPPAVTAWRVKKVPVSATLQKAIEEAVRNSLKDPESARFKHSVAFKDSDKVISACGLVNAKNAYGGYVGFEPYRAFVGVEKGKYTGAAAVFGGGKYPQTFFEVNPMCDPKNW